MSQSRAHNKPVLAKVAANARPTRAQAPSGRTHPAAPEVRQRGSAYPDVSRRSALPYIQLRCGCTVQSLSWHRPHCSPMNRPCWVSSAIRYQRNHASTTRLSWVRTGA